MEYRYLGNSGVKVSEISLGVMTFGGNIANELATISQNEANRIVDLSIDQGINLFDTADVYSGGISETVLGQALLSHRHSALIATKVRFAMGTGPNETGLSRLHIIKSCENSLKRLKTDYIDLYQIHSYDKATPLEETLSALDTLVTSGKVRYIGCSNLTAWQTMKALAISEKLNLQKFITTQLYYSIGARDIEHELLPLCTDQKIGILCWSPLSGGFFTGKYSKNKPLPSGARRSNKTSASMKFWPVDEEKGFKIIDALAEIATRYEKTIAQTALSWILSKNEVSTIVTGISSADQLLENTKASGYKLNADDLALLNEISKPEIPYPIWHQNYSDPR
jgi:aryl-alcohol dehydrogenase-like predicted oxidoreductase